MKLKKPMKIARKLFQWILAGVAIAMLGCSITGRAAVAFVTVGTNNTDTFTPAVTNINAGDSVVWVWNYSLTFIPHTSTSGTNGVSSGLWDAGTNSSPHSFTNTFSSAGTYVYFCRIHYATPNFMTGAVVVASVALPPTVSLTNPPSGSVFAAPANVTIQATASGNGGTLTNVEFLANSTVLGNVTTAPYSVVANSLAAGGYTLSAMAANNSGLTATSSVSISVVNPSPIVLSAPAMQPAPNFQFSFTADAGLRYVVQRATNLDSANWLSLATNTAGSSSMTFTDANATVNPGFYRVGLLPNP
jgi:plastocyanin